MSPDLSRSSSREPTPSDVEYNQQTDGSESGQSESSNSSRSYSTYSTPNDGEYEKARRFKFSGISSPSSSKSSGSPPAAQIDYQSQSEEDSPASHFPLAIAIAEELRARLFPDLLEMQSQMLSQILSALSKPEALICNICKGETSSGNQSSSALDLHPNNFENTAPQTNASYSESTEPSLNGFGMQGDGGKCITYSFSRFQGFILRCAGLTAQENLELFGYYDEFDEEQQGLLVNEASMPVIVPAANGKKSYSTESY